jgi:hypothetical protein
LTNPHQPHPKCDEARHKRDEEFIHLLLNWLGGVDNLCQTLSGRNKGNFVSFKDLYWLIKYVGDNINDVVNGQKNIKKIVNSLDIIASIILCISIAFVYGKFLHPSLPFNSYHTI